MVKAGLRNVAAGANPMALKRGIEKGVVAVGPGKFNEDGDARVPVDVAVGDTVIYSKYGGTEWKDADGIEYQILSARDVLAVVGK